MEPTPLDDLARRAENDELTPQELREALVVLATSLIETRHLLGKLERLERVLMARIEARENRA